jgi:hypothetical protein
VVRCLSMCHPATVRTACRYVLACRVVASAFALAGWEPTTGALRVDLLFGWPLLLETRVSDCRVMAILPICATEVRQTQGCKVCLQPVVAHRTESFPGLQGCGDPAWCGQHNCCRCLHCQRIMLGCLLACTD